MASPQPPPSSDSLVSFTHEQATIAQLTQILITQWLEKIGPSTLAPSVPLADDQALPPIASSRLDLHHALAEAVIELLALSRFTPMPGADQQQRQIWAKITQNLAAQFPAESTAKSTAKSTAEATQPTRETSTTGEPPTIPSAPTHSPTHSSPDTPIDRGWHWLQASGAAWGPPVYHWAQTSGTLLKHHWVQVLGHQSLNTTPSDPADAPTAFTYLWDPQTRCITQGQWVTASRPLSRAYGHLIQAGFAQPQPSPSSADATIDPPPRSTPSTALPHPPLWVIGPTLDRWADLLEIHHTGATFWIALEPTEATVQPLEDPYPLKNFSRDCLWEQRVRLPASFGAGLIVRRILVQAHGTSMADRRSILTNTPPDQVSAHQAAQLVILAQQPPRLTQDLSHSLARTETESALLPPIALAFVAHNLLETTTALIQQAVFPFPLPSRSPSPWQRLLYNNRLSRVVRRYILKKLPANNPPTPTATQTRLQHTLHRDWVIETIQAIAAPCLETLRSGTDMEPAPAPWGTSAGAAATTTAAAIDLNWQALHPLLSQVPTAFAQTDPPDSPSPSGSPPSNPSPPAHTTPASTPLSALFSLHQVPTWYYLQVDTNLHALATIFQNLDAVRFHCPGETLWPQCKLALAEGFSNAVRYAHQSYPHTTPLDLEVVITSRSLELRIWDYGYPFSFWRTLGRPGFSLHPSRMPLTDLGWRMERWSNHLRRQAIDRYGASVQRWLLKHLPLAVGGRGLALMQEIADYLDYIALDDGRNCLVLIKYFPKADS
ncbi:MAG: ATP-binding protein [Prochlorothrix sp.]